MLLTTTFIESYCTFCASIIELYIAKKQLLKKQYNS